MPIPLQTLPRLNLLPQPLHPSRVDEPRPPLLQNLRSPMEFSDLVLSLRNTSISRILLHQPQPPEVPLTLPSNLTYGGVLQLLEFLQVVD